MKHIFLIGNFGTSEMLILLIVVGLIVFGVVILFRRIFITKSHSQGKLESEHLKNTPTVNTPTNLHGQSKIEQNDIFNQLERLAKLKEQGIITDEEFKNQKKKILG